MADVIKNKRMEKEASKRHEQLQKALSKYVHDSHFNLSTSHKMLNVEVWRRDSLRVAKRHPMELERPGSDEDIDSESQLKRICKIEQEFAAVGQNEYTFTSLGQTSSLQNHPNQLREGSN